MSGQGLGASGSFGTDRGFTGQTVDAAAGLYWFASRSYDPSIGRFVQPDTVVPDWTNPQALNRYAYALNNPLRYVDPSGHDPIGPEWEREWADNHPQQTLTDQDRLDRLISVTVPGSGEGGAWTSADWDAYRQDRGSFMGRESMDSRLNPGETGAQQFARYLDSLAGWYSPGETEQFVRAVGALFAGIDLSGSPYAAMAGSAVAPADPYLNVNPSGLRPQFVGRGDENQTHHYAAFLMAGYYLGVHAVGINTAREALAVILKGDVDPGDIALGNLAAAHGGALRNAPNGYRFLGVHVRADLVD